MNEQPMANTKSARKATRQIARRTEINKARRSNLRGSVRKVEEAILSGDRAAATAALKAAEPVIMRAAQRGVVHKNNASRKVSRLAHRIAKLGSWTRPILRDGQALAPDLLHGKSVEFVAECTITVAGERFAPAICKNFMLLSLNFARVDFTGQSFRPTPPPGN
jgi:small subunit ribosomal protein S20